VSLQHASRWFHGFSGKIKNGASSKRINLSPKKIQREISTATTALILLFQGKLPGFDSNLNYSTE
jgi:hypothetical protein